MQSHYDPDTRTVVLAPNVTLYEGEHERAHKAQDDENALCFRVWRKVWRLRGLGWLATMWVEFDAYRRTRASLMQTGQWTTTIEKEARQCLQSYVTRKERR
jgi:Zn-dependent membrane protease YugP